MLEKSTKELNEANIRISDVESAKDQLADQIVKLQQELSIQTSELKMAQKLESQYRIENEAMTSKVTTLEEKNCELNIDLKNFKKKCKSSDYANENLKKELETKTSEILELIDTSEKQRKEGEFAIDALKLKCEKLEQQVFNLQILEDPNKPH